MNQTKLGEEGRSSFGGGRKGAMIYEYDGSAVVGEEAFAAARVFFRDFGGNAVLFFLMPAPVWGEQHTLSMAEIEVEAKQGKVGTNSEEVKLVEDKR